MATNLGPSGLVARELPRSWFTAALVQEPLYREERFDCVPITINNCCCQLRPLAFMHVFRVGFQTSHTLYYLREFIQFTANPILFKIVGLHCIFTASILFFHYFFKTSNESKCEGILNQISSYIKIQRSKVLFFLMNWNEYYFFGRIISFFNFRKNLIQNCFNWCYKYHSFQQLFSKTNLTSLQQFFFVRISIRFQRDLK